LEVTVGHTAYGRLHITEYVFPDVDIFGLWQYSNWVKNGSIMYI
jgi:hypothetical protein